MKRNVGWGAWMFSLEWGLEQGLGRNGIVAVVGGGLARAVRARAVRARMVASAKSQWRRAWWMEERVERWREEEKSRREVTEELSESHVRDRGRRGVEGDLR